MKDLNGICLAMIVVSSASLAMLAAGCAGGTSHTVAIAEVETIGPGALAIDVQNQLGEVEVVVDAAAAHPFVEAVPMDPEASTGRIDRGSAFIPWTAAQVAVGEGGRVLRVLCTAREGEPARPVYLRVRVPECEGVRVRNRGGPVTLQGISGSIDVDNLPSTPPMWDEGAAVYVRTQSALDRDVTLVSSDGEVVLSMARSSRGKLAVHAPETRVDLAAVKGTQKSDGSVTAGSGSFTGTLNGGDNAITLRSGRRATLTTVVEVVAPARASSPSPPAPDATQKPADAPKH